MNAIKTAIIASLLVTTLAIAAQVHGRLGGSGTDATLAHASVVAWSAGRAERSTSADADSVDVLTAHNGSDRLGWNAHETALTPATVRGPAFGKLAEIPLDGQVFAQPLIVTGIDLGARGRHTLAIVATENDSVYALDADSGATLWVHSFIGCCGVAAARADAVAGSACHTVAPRIGISSTPVIDRRTQTLYVVAKTATGRADNPVFSNAIYALNLITGADRMPPVRIAGEARWPVASFVGGNGSLRQRVKRLMQGNTFRFDARTQFNRPGLLLANGMVYVGFSSHCDADDAHGWVFAYDATDLHQTAAFPTIGEWNAVNGGGVWQSGFGLTADAQGSVYFTTGNGPFTADRGGRDYGDSLVKLAPRGDRVVDFFTPFTQAELAANDADFGGGGMIALPDRAGRFGKLGVTSSKLRAIFLVDRNDLGGFTSGGPDRVLHVIGDDHSQTRWCVGTCGGPAYYRASDGREYVLNVWAYDSLRAYRVDRDGPRPRLTESDRSTDPIPGWGGTTPSISSDGVRAGTAIVWATTRPAQATTPIALLAYDAAHLARPLYHGDVSRWRNMSGVPFLTPTIANGKVYVGGDHSLSIFGLREPRVAKR